MIEGRMDAIKGNFMISKISLGTAQFGQDYGIANTRGKVSRSEVAEIFDYSRSVGIHCLDTAFSYGESESVIGEYMLGKLSHFKIVSKLPHFGPYRSGKAEEFLEQSLQRLGIKRLYGYLLHNFNDSLAIGDIWNDLVRLKENGKVEKIGFSLYFPEKLVYLLDKGIAFDMVQVPHSIFDRRFEKYFDHLNENGIEIQVRSVFLQGLAFLGVNHLPASLQKARPQLENLRQVARDQKISIEALCLNFVLVNSYINQVVVGVDSLAQLKNNVANLDLIDSVRDVYDQLHEIMIEDENILVPYKWSVA